MYIWALFLEKFVYLVVKIKKFKKCKKYKQKQQQNSWVIVWTRSVVFYFCRQHYQQRATFLLFFIFEPRPSLFSKLVCQNNNKKHIYQLYKYFFSKQNQWDLVVVRTGDSAPVLKAFFREVKRWEFMPNRQEPVAIEMTKHLIS